MTYDEILTKLYKDLEQVTKTQDDHLQGYLNTSLQTLASFHIDMIRFYEKEVEDIVFQIIRVSALRGEA